jgi:Ca2+-binding RTX toxin-like protein
VFGKASGFAANLALSALDGSNGFQISGEAAGDRSGASVASAGDVNGDGFDDVIIGASFADPNGSQSGASYVVFGKAPDFASNLALSVLDGSNGFQINGEAEYDFSGSSVASAGDVNGDGFADLIIGASGADPNGGSSGASYVVFGKASGFAANLELSALDGTNGFQISGVAQDDRSGSSVASAGDVNGDGFADLIIGASGADPNGNSSGASYVVFGKASGFAANLELSALDGTNGFQINGEAAGHGSGLSVASAGDVNGDGFADLIVGAFGADPNGNSSGASYVVFGRATASINRVGTDQADRLYSGDFDDTLAGLGGDDTLWGSEGADSLDGGTGTDTADYSTSLGAVTVNLTTGVHGGSDAEGDTLTGIENLVGSVFDDALTGDGIANVLDGNDGNDTLSGLAGNDTLIGRVGSDTFIGGIGADWLDGGADSDTADYSTSAQAVMVDLSTGTGEGGDAEGDTLVLIEGIVGSALGDRLTGDANSNMLDGRGGNDTLIGGAGADRLDGGADIDTADYSASTSAVTVNLSTGIGAGGDAAGDTLAAIEALIGSAFGDSLTGDDWANVLDGLNGNDTLAGGAGADSLDGGSGTDTADYSASSAAVSVDLAAGSGSGGDAEGDTLTGIENLVGSIFGDVLAGDGKANVLHGSDGTDTLTAGGGRDTLIGGAGADSLDGGSGRDTADYSTSGGAVTVDLAAGSGAGGDAEGDTFVAIENVVGSAFGDRLTGDARDNVLEGRDGADVLIGGAGADSLDGGANTDTADYSASPAAVTVNLMTGAHVGGDAAGDTLTAVENVSGSAFGDSLTGDSGGNRLHGRGGNDTLIGLGGNDTLIGGGSSDSLDGSGGNDTLVGGSLDDSLRGADGDDSLDGGTGNDRLSGGTGSDTLDGGTGNDRLSGGTGSDTLDGGAGDDVLIGGPHADRFVFAPGDGTGRIKDFEDNFDKLDLTGFGFATVAEARSFAANVGGDVVFDFAGGEQLIVENITKLQLTSFDILI